LAPAGANGPNSAAGDFFEKKHLKTTVFIKVSGQKKSISPYLGREKSPPLLPYLTGSEPTSSAGGRARPSFRLPADPEPPPPHPNPISYTAIHYSLLLSFIDLKNIDFLALFFKALFYENRFVDKFGRLWIAVYGLKVIVLIEIYHEPPLFPRTASSSLS
jgi:hypothetical protein